jgi:hypothetical protein
MAGMRRGTRFADAQAKETTYSGLPKAWRGWRNSHNGWTTNTWVSAYFDRPDDISTWNHGGYTYDNFVGAVFSKIIVPEPGIYTVQGQVSVEAIAAYIWAGIWVNGIQSGDPVAGAPIIQAGAFGPGAAGGAQIMQVGYPAKLRAGDYIQLMCYSAGGTTQDLIGYTWMSIIKEGGQY